MSQFSILYGIPGENHLFGKSFKDLKYFKYLIQDFILQSTGNEQIPTEIDQKK